MLKTIKLPTLIVQGGWIMLPIILLSLISIYIILDRFFVLLVIHTITEPWTEQLKKCIIHNKINDVQKLCKKKNMPIARMIEESIIQTQNTNHLEDFEKCMETIGVREIYNLEKGLKTLATISGVAPMLGFLGTVIGMIQAFMSISRSENVFTPQLLSSGIYEAMITTAAGLIVGIIAYLAYNLLLTRVQRITHHTTYAALAFINFWKQLKALKH